MKIKKLKKSCFKFLSITVIISIFLQLVSLTAFAAGTQKGDVNGDGKITLKDARMVLNSVALISILPYEKVDIADYDDDGILTTADAINILKLAIDLPPEMVELKYFKQMTPKSSNGVSGKSKFCVVKQENAETLPAKPINNTSNPLYTPLLEGTYDYIESGPVKHADSGKVFYVLKSGRRVYSDAVSAFTGYNMPVNTVEVMSKVDSTKSETKFYLKLAWRVPFNVTIKPQEYVKGYNGRVFNLKDEKFTGSYMDMTFYYTKSPVGNISFPDSEIIKSMKWIENSEKGTTTLRIYFKNAGEFAGYNVYYDKNNYLVVSVKEPSDALSDRVIMIDPGHGGAQPGAGSGTGVYEKDVTYKMALELKKLLEARGATVLFSRNDAASVPEIEERRLNTYKLNPDLFISIHCDSSESKSSNGSSVYYYKNYSGPLAFAIAKSLPAAVKSETGYGMQNKGAHFYPFLVTRIEVCPSVLVECGFISNSSDFRIINSASGRKAIAKGIYNGILDYYGY